MPSEARWAKCLQVAQVVQVHREYPVESREVIEVHLPRAQGRQVVTALSGVRNRATVRRLAGVPIADTGRVDEQLVLQSGECRVPAEHGFRRRRAADVAHANEEYAALGREVAPDLDVA